MPEGLYKSITERENASLYYPDPLPEGARLRLWQSKSNGPPLPEGLVYRFATVAIQTHSRIAHTRCMCRDSLELLVQVETTLHQGIKRTQRAAFRNHSIMFLLRLLLLNRMLLLYLLLLRLLLLQCCY